MVSPLNNSNWTEKKTENTDKWSLCFNKALYYNIEPIQKKFLKKFFKIKATKIPCVFGSNSGIIVLIMEMYSQRNL